MTTHREPLPSVLDTIGETPLVRVHVSPDEVPVYAKLESFNPGASVKDRIGRYMLERMLEEGTLDGGGTIVEPTAGNTGIGLALAAGQLGVEAVFVVPERFSVEKQRLMRALGAEVVNTPTADGIAGAIDRAEELAEERGGVVPQQFSNPLNAEAHYETTAPEIDEALDGEVGAVVAGCGTAGTLMGMARYFREREPSTFVSAVEPEGSVYRRTVGEDPPHGEYKTEGIGTSDAATNELFDVDLVSEIATVTDERAQEELKRLAREEGHLVASSSGAASVAALNVARRIRDGELDAPYDSVVTVFPDSSERYLSKGIYGSFEEWQG
ncbi:PLP-dependent cysteine synthase family protein [Halomarina litorea]|uniref:PLP-dependent cysteine synthase family protein n=1 Tax=Halomarina litorea TaxID=2961595 RepID=UPI0020C583AB|nr:PLP-dependent cysteine synthase family protein [Halomarina sp. BCD28]